MNGVRTCLSLAPRRNAKRPGRSTPASRFANPIQVETPHAHLSPQAGRGREGAALPARGSRDRSAHNPRLAVAGVLVVLVDIMSVDGDATVTRPADSGSDIRGVATGPNYCDGRVLRNEDEVVVGIRRHRVRSARLRNLFDEEFCLGVDDAQHRSAGVFAGAQIVAPIAGVEVNLIGSGDAVDADALRGLGAEDGRLGVTRVVAWSAANHQFIVHTDGGAIWSAGSELH